MIRETAMNPVAKALFIESHFATDLTLGEIADVAGVSRFHMVQAFNAVTGHSVMRYVRARRLTEAARALARGALDILTVALDAGYGSHEAFTRAFRDQFSSIPDKVRAGAIVDNLTLGRMERRMLTTCPICWLQWPARGRGKPQFTFAVTQSYRADRITARSTRTVAVVRAE